MTKLGTALIYSFVSIFTFIQLMSPAISRYLTRHILKTKTTDDLGFYRIKKNRYFLKPKKVKACSYSGNNFSTYRNISI